MWDGYTDPIYKMYLDKLEADGMIKRPDETKWFEATFEGYFFHGYEEEAKRVYISEKRDLANIYAVTYGGVAAVVAGLYAVYQMGTGLLAFAYDIVRHHYPFLIFDQP